MKPSIKERWTPFHQYACDIADFLLKNKTHTVLVHLMNETPEGWACLSIKRNDRQAECDWRILQRIKNDIMGEDREAVQLFPSMERVLDTANQYFLFVAPKNYIIGLGQVEREVSDETYAQKVGAKQRPFEKGDPLKNLVQNITRSEKVSVFPLPLHPKKC